MKKIHEFIRRGGVGPRVSPPVAPPPSAPPTPSSPAHRRQGARGPRSVALSPAFPQRPARYGLREEQGVQGGRTAPVGGPRPGQRFVRYECGRGVGWGSAPPDCPRRPAPRREVEKRPGQHRRRRTAFPSLRPEGAARPVAFPEVGGGRSTVPAAGPARRRLTSEQKGGY